MAKVLEMIDVELTDIHPHTHNLRLDMDGIDALARSVTAVGILQPLLVAPREAGGYTIVAGHRRHAAAELAGLKTVPCLVGESAEATQAIAMLHENIERDGLTPAEVAKGIQAALDLGATQKELAAGLGLSTKEIRRYKETAGFSETTKNTMHELHLTLDQTIQLAAFDEYPEVLQQVIEELRARPGSTWAYRQGERLIGQINATEVAKQVAENLGAVYLSDLQGRTVETLNTEQANAHAGLDCYAITTGLAHDPLNLRHLCTSPKSHRTATKHTPEAEAERTARALVRTNNAVWRDVTTVRQEWLASNILERKTAPKGALTPLTILLTSHVPNDTEFAAAFSTISGATHKYWELTTALVSENITNDQVATRQILHTVIGSIESAAIREVWRGHSPRFAFYLNTLAQWGYPLSPPESAYVKALADHVDPSTVDYSNIEE